MEFTDSAVPIFARCCIAYIRAGRGKEEERHAGAQGSKFDALLSWWILVSLVSKAKLAGDDAALQALEGADGTDVR